jgi:tetratricopeptide (TPR) repeat protein
VTRPALIYRCPDAFGLGATLIMIAAYAGYCARHGLDLALDMRRFQYFPAHRHASFFEAFEIHLPADMALVTDPARIEDMARDAARIDAVQARRLSLETPPPAGNIDVEGVVSRGLAPWFGVVPPPGFAIRLKGWLHETVEAALGTMSWRNVVGVHFRHGNGEFLQSREDFLTAPDYRDRIVRFQESMAARVAETAAGRRVFVAGDNREFVEYMRRAVPAAFTLGTPIPDVPYIEYLREVGPERALAEAAIDLWALASCEEIVCVPSSFAEAAALLNPAARLQVIDDFKLGTRADHAVQAARIRLLATPQETAPWRRLSAALEAAGRVEEAQACAGIADAWMAGAVSAERITAELQGAAGIGETVTQLGAALGQGAYEAHAARNLARLLVNAGLADLAQGLLEAIIRSSPFDAELHARLADIFDGQGRLAEAVGEARLATQLAPAAASHRLLLAKLLYRAGDPQARELLAEAASMLKRARSSACE